MTTEIICLDCKNTNHLSGSELQQPKCISCQTNLPWIVAADDTDLDQHLQAKVPILLDFWATWCGPCIQLAPLISDLATLYRGRLKVIKADIDQTRHYAGFYKISALPTILVGVGGRDGAFRETIVGAVPRKKLIDAIEKVMPKA